MSLPEIISLSLAVVFIFSFAFLMIESNANMGKPYVRDILREIKDDKKIFSIIRAILRKGCLTDKEIIEMSGDRLMPLYILFLGSHSYHIGLSLGPLPPNLPAITYRDRNKIKISPKWLEIIKKAQSADWDIQKINLPRC